MLVADVLIEKLSPIRTHMLELLKSPEYLEKVLESGSNKAKEIAATTWLEVSQKIGLERNITSTSSEIRKVIL